MLPATLILACGFFESVEKPQVRIVPIPLQSMQNQLDDLNRFIKDSRQSQIERLEKSHISNCRTIEYYKKKQNVEQYADLIQKAQKREKDLQLLLERVKKE